MFTGTMRFECMADVIFRRCSIAVGTCRDKSNIPMKPFEHQRCVIKLRVKSAGSLSVHYYGRLPNKSRKIRFDCKTCRAHLSSLNNQVWAIVVPTLQRLPNNFEETHIAYLRHTQSPAPCSVSCPCSHGCAIVLTEPAINTTATLRNVTHLPRSITYAQAIEQLHNHELLIRLDPEYVSHETLPSDPTTPEAKIYRVTDHMNALPAGLWDTTVKFEAHMTDLDDGILWFIKAPLGLTQKTTWRCLKTESLGDEHKGGSDEDGEWSLVEDVEITANRMLVKTVRAKCEDNWRGTHGRFLEQLKGSTVAA